jgi:tyrosine-protein phosphatase OCA6
MNYDVIPPLRFGVVNPSLYRGSYPTLRNHRFLSRLRLRTIICLIQEPPNDDLKAFADTLEAKIVFLPVNRNSSISNPVLSSTLIQALNMCMDTRNFPIYVHCLDGKRICSLLVLMIRRLQGWTPISALSEYWRFQLPSKSPISSIEVEKSTKELQEFVVELRGVIVTEFIPKWLWYADKSTNVQGVHKISSASSRISNG